MKKLLAMKSITAILLAALLFSVAVLLFPGCTKCTTSNAESSPLDPELLKNITLTEIGPEGLTKAVGQHRGSVVLVDFWATWCGPCMELFPHTVALRKRFSPDDLAVITVSMDKLDRRESVLEFLRFRRANTENYQNSIESDSEAFDAYAIQEGIPHLRIYDRAGNLYRTVNGNRPAEIEQAVVEAMGKRNANQ